MDKEEEVEIEEEDIVNLDLERESEWRKDPKLERDYIDTLKQAPMSMYVHSEFDLIFNF